MAEVIHDRSDGTALKIEKHKTGNGMAWTKAFLYGEDTDGNPKAVLVDSSGKIVLTV